MYMNKYVTSQVTIVRDATDSTTRRAVIRLPGMHSVKQLNLRGFRRRELRADHLLLIVAGAPGHGLTHHPHLSCIRPKLSSFLKYTFPCFLSRLLLPELHLHPLPSHPTHLAVVVWVAPIDDDDPLPLLRPYSKRPEGLRHIYFANSSRPVLCEQVDRRTPFTAGKINTSVPSLSLKTVPHSSLSFGLEVQPFPSRAFAATIREYLSHYRTPFAIPPSPSSVTAFRK